MEEHDICSIKDPDQNNALDLETTIGKTLSSKYQYVYGAFMKA